MTRKDYELIAKAIKYQSINGKGREIMPVDWAMYTFAKDIAAYLETDNPRFDNPRFMKACGFGESE